jgi:NCAIR mutase (PurE)-related protein
VNPADIARLLDAVKGGSVSVADAVDRLRSGLADEHLGFATLDHQRALRTGFPEVIFGAGKTPEQIVAIADRIAARGHNVLVTRADPSARRALVERFPAARDHAEARCVTLRVTETAPIAGRLAVVCAGTSDVPVAEEAVVTAEAHGASVERVYDVGVAGLHRLLGRTDSLRQAHVLIVAAGMEGALPSVVAGLVEAPVIAVPTSVGYGASFHGLAALLAMLNSCAAGISVVNIDNGFGAAMVALGVLRTAQRVKAV